MKFDADFGGTISYKELCQALAIYLDTLYEGWTPQKLGSSQNSDPIRECVFASGLCPHNDCELLASGSDDGAVRVYQMISSGAQLITRMVLPVKDRGEVIPVTTLMWQGSSCRSCCSEGFGGIVSGTAAGSVHLWDTFSWTLMLSFDVSPGIPVNKISLSQLAGTTHVTTSSADCVGVWHIDSVRKRQTDKHSIPHGIALRKDGRTVVSMLETPMHKGHIADPMLRQWDLGTGVSHDVVADLEDVLLSGSVIAIAHTTRYDKQTKLEREMLAVARSSGNVWLLVEDGAGWVVDAALSAHTASTTCVQFSCAGNQIASAAQDRSIVVWWLKTNEVEQRFRLKGHMFSVLDIAFSNDDLWLASASADCDVNVWSLTEGVLVAVLSGHSSAVTSVRWSPSAKHLRIASASAEGTVRLWDVTEATQLHGVFQAATQVLEKAEKHEEAEQCEAETARVAQERIDAHSRLTNAEKSLEQTRVMEASLPDRIAMAESTVEVCCLCVAAAALTFDWAAYAGGAQSTRCQPPSCPSKKLRAEAAQ